MAFPSVKCALSARMRGDLSAVAEPVQKCRTCCLIGIWTYQRPRIALTLSMRHLSLGLAPLPHDSVVDGQIALPLAVYPSHCPMVSIPAPSVAARHALAYVFPLQPQTDSDDAGHSPGRGLQVASASARPQYCPST